MKIIKNPTFHANGLIECNILLGDKWKPHALLPGEEYQISEDSEWSEIREYAEPVKTNEQLRYEIIAELSALDASPRLIEGALLGDQYSIDKLAKNEGLKIDLREKLAAI